MKTNNREQYFKQRYEKNAEKLRLQRRERYQRKIELERKEKESKQLSIFDNVSLLKLDQECETKQALIQALSHSETLSMCETTKNSETNQLSIFGNECGTLRLIEEVEQSETKNEWNKVLEQEVGQNDAIVKKCETKSNVEQSDQKSETFDVKHSLVQEIEIRKKPIEAKRNYFLIAIGFFLSLCALIILQNDSLNFYLSEKSAFTLWSLFSVTDGTSILALLKSSVPEFLMFFIGITPAIGFKQNMAKWSLILAIAVFQICSVSMNVFDSSQESISQLKNSIQKQVLQSEIVSTLKTQEKELMDALSLANSFKEGSGANIWIIRSLTRRLNETRESLRGEIQKQGAVSVPADEIQKKIDRLRIKNIMFVFYRVIIFSSSLFLMSFLSKLIFYPEKQGIEGKKEECAYARA